MRKRGIAEVGFIRRCFARLQLRYLLELQQIELRANSGSRRMFGIDR